VARSTTGWSHSLTCRLIELRKDGISNAGIAAILGVRKPTLEAHISRLIACGVIPSRKGLLWSHPDCYTEGRERTPQSVAPDLERLYAAGTPYREIAAALGLTEHQVHNLLTGLFAAGLAKRKPHKLTEQQVRSIHAAYLAGASIDKRAEQLGFSGTAVRERMRRLGLPLGRAVGGRA
jgi:DNA-binding CsgD family transcriptional regulator